MAIVSSRVSRVARLVAVGAIAATVLTACIKVDADVTVNPDATATGTFSLALQKDAANFLGITDVKTFADGISSGDVTGGDTGLGEFKDCTPSETDTDFVYSCTFQNASFTDQNGPWTITQDGDLITFHMASQSPTAGQDANANPLGDSSLGSITVKVEFPGSITSIEGKGAEQTSDTSATITSSLTDSVDATIVAQSSSGFALSSLLVILIFAAILILIIAVVVVLILRRRSAGSDLDAETVAAAEAIPVAEDAIALSGAEMAELEAPAEPADAAPEETAAEETAPQDTDAEETAPQDTDAEETAPQDTDAEETPPAPPA